MTRTGAIHRVQGTAPKGQMHDSAAAQWSALSCAQLQHERPNASGKMRIDAGRYPVAQARSSGQKYTELQSTAGAATGRSVR